MAGSPTVRGMRRIARARRPEGPVVRKSLMGRGGRRHHSAAELAGELRLHLLRLAAKKRLHRILAAPEPVTAIRN